MKTVQKERLTLYPAAYGLIVNGGKILLMKMRHTGKFHLPGGGISLGERMNEFQSYEINSAGK